MTKSEEYKKHSEEAQKGIDVSIANRPDASLKPSEGIKSVIAEGGLRSHLPEFNPNLGSEESTQESLAMQRNSNLKEKIQQSQSQAYGFSETNNPDDFLSKGGYNSETFIVVINGTPVLRSFVTR
jgi:sulfur carrier protein ThiS